ncbi:MAG: c-type cytochrome domain-containing protein, partial [Phycisphaerales bacterium]
MRRIVSTILLLLTSAASAQTMEGLDQAAAGEQRPLTADELKFFESKVRPLLIANCYGCHSTSGGKSKGGLKLDTREATLKGGNSGPAVVPGDPDSSLL